MKVENNGLDQEDHNKLNKIGGKNPGLLVMPYWMWYPDMCWRERSLNWTLFRAPLHFLDLDTISRINIWLYKALRLTTKCQPSTVTKASELITIDPWLYPYWRFFSWINSSMCKLLLTMFPPLYNFVKTRKNVIVARHWRGQRAIKLHKKVYNIFVCLWMYLSLIRMQWMIITESSVTQVIFVKL